MENNTEQLVLKEDNDKENIIGEKNINSSGNNIEMAAVKSNNLFQEDVLSIITNRLDFDDLYFPFGAVCHDWRDSFSKFLKKFMASPSPLMLQMLKPWDGIVTFSSFIDGSIYKPKLPRLTSLKYLGFSAGNMIMLERFTGKFLLLNPFRRKKIQIREPYLLAISKEIRWNHAILAYGVGSEDEFTIVVMTKPCKHLFSYQSRNDSWMRYDGLILSGEVVDVVVLHRALYAIDSCGKIGVVSLNIPWVKYIDQIKNAPNVWGYTLKLVVFEGKLLVVQFKNSMNFEIMIHRIDFAAMEWIEIQSLENNALFLSKRCYAMSDPGKFGYLANHLYYVDGEDACKVYQLNGDLVLSISRHDVLPMPVIGRSRLVDWCFMNFREEVDYSLDD